MRSKLWSVVGVLVALSLLLTACAPAAPQVVEKPVVQTQIVEKQVVQTQVVEKQSTVEVVVTATPEPVVERPKVTIEWWTDPAFVTAPRCETCKNPGDFEKQAIDEYVKANPNVTVNLQVLDWGDLPKKVPAAIAGGSPPDILKDYLGRTSGYAYEEGVLVDMNKVLPKEVIDDVLPGLLDLYNINGILHAFPTYFWEQHLLYNKALLVKAGIPEEEMPREDWTFDDMYNLIEKVKKAVPEMTYGFATQVASEQGDYANHAFIWNAGSRTWKEDCSGLDLDNPKAVAGFEFFNKLYQDKMMNQDATTAGYENVNDVFYQGKAVFMGGGLTNQEVLVPQAIKDGRVTVEMDAQQSLYPHAAGEKPAGLPVGPSGFVIFEKKDRTPAELDEIVKFLLFINGEKWQREAVLNNQQFPARASVGVPLAGNPKYEQALAWVQKYGTSTMGLQCPHFAEMRVMQPAFWQQMVLGKLTPQETADAIMEQSKKIMAQ
jgi:ABC-type glycerol-3-phosphate transport system substrate-binding protein